MLREGLIYSVTMLLTDALIWLNPIPDYQYQVMKRVKTSVLSPSVLLQYRDDILYQPSSVLTVDLPASGLTVTPQVVGGVTRVCLTWGGNWQYFSLKKKWLFSHHPLQSHNLHSCRLVTTPTFRRHFSSVLSKFSHKIIISFGCHPLDGVTWSSPPPHSLPPSEAIAGSELKWGDILRSQLLSRFNTRRFTVRFHTTCPTNHSYFCRQTGYNALK